MYHSRKMEHRMRITGALYISAVKHIFESKRKYVNICAHDFVDFKKSRTV